MDFVRDRRLKKIVKFRFSGFFFVAALMVCTCGGSLLAEQGSDAKPAAGILRFTSDQVKSIQLEDSGQVSIINVYGDVELKPGKYRIQQVTLDGDWSSFVFRTIEIKAGEVTKLDYGPPLEHKVTAQREGYYLALNDEVRGAGGNTYTKSGSSDAAEFTIYQGEAKVHSGKFAYG